MNTSSAKMLTYPVSEDRRASILARIQSDRANKAQRTADMEKRQKVGLVIAKEAAKILKEQFHAERVVLFGSLLSPEKMHERSDIDIAVWGLAKDQLLSAWSMLDRQLNFQSIFPYIDLATAETAPPYIQESIEDMCLEL